MTTADKRGALRLLAERLDAALVKVAADRRIRFVDDADAIRGLRARVTVGDLTLIPPRFVMRATRPAVPLGPVQFGVLNQLMSNPGKVLSYERILDETWGYRAATNKHTNDTVGDLRAKIGAGDPEIDAVRGFGYVLRAPGAFLDPDQDGAIKFADVVLNPLTRSAKRGDRPLTLDPAWFRMLERFMRTPGQVVRKSELAIAAARPGCELPSPESMKTHLYFLRRQLESGGEPRLIHNERGVGFKLDTPIAPGSATGQNG